MIVQPDFLDHWKTRRLIEITADPSSPLAVLRLWAHCQNSKRGTFPDMTPQQLASVCWWGERKPACHVALVKAGFVRKLSPKGFAAHEWAEHNAKLLANWENGKLGGRPRKEENANESATKEKPTGFSGLTQSEPIEQTEQTDKKRTEQTDANGVGLVRSSAAGLVQGLVKGCSPPPASGYSAHGVPTLQQVEQVMEREFSGGKAHARRWYESMIRQGWKDGRGHPVHNWKALAKSYVNACGCKERLSRG